ncbi:MAG: VOC family protein [Gammaproteobacteria bacterium]
MITGIHHAQIAIPKGREREAREFYCGLLGLKEVPKPPAQRARGGLWLQVGDRQVHIGVEDGVERKLTKVHIPYEVSDLALWCKRLTDVGIGLLSGEQIPGHERFEFRDPFGNRVELIQRL